LAKRFAARGPTSATSAGHDDRPAERLRPAGDGGGRNTAGASVGEPGSAVASAFDLVFLVHAAPVFLFSRP